MFRSCIVLAGRAASVHVGGDFTGVVANLGGAECRGINISGQLRGRGSSAADSPTNMDPSDKEPQKMPTTSQNSQAGRSWLGCLHPGDVIRNNDTVEMV